MGTSKPFVVEKHSVAGMGRVRKWHHRPADGTMPKQSGNGGSKDRCHGPPADAFDSPHPCLKAEVFINLDAVRPGSRGDEWRRAWTIYRIGAGGMGSGCGGGTGEGGIGFPGGDGRGAGGIGLGSPGPPSAGGPAAMATQSVAVRTKSLNSRQVSRSWINWKKRLRMAASKG